MPRTGGRVASAPLTADVFEVSLLLPLRRWADPPRLVALQHCSCAAPGRRSRRRRCGCFGAVVACDKHAVGECLCVYTDSRRGSHFVAPTPPPRLFHSSLVQDPPHPLSRPIHTLAHTPPSHHSSSPSCPLPFPFLLFFFSPFHIYPASLVPSAMRLQQRSSSADLNDRRNFRVHRLIERATGRPPPARRVNVSDISGPVEVLVPVGESSASSQASLPGRSNSLSSSITSRISRAFSISDRRTATTASTHIRSHSTSASVIMGLRGDFATLSPPLTASTSSNWSYEDVATARHGYTPSSASTSATATPTSAACEW